VISDQPYLDTADCGIYGHTRNAMAAVLSSSPRVEPARALADMPWMTAE
jgi:hypothetical protein